MESRIKSTRLLGRAIRQLAHPPRLWMNASTATIYRHIFDRPMDDQTGEIGGQRTGYARCMEVQHRCGHCLEKAFFEAETPNTRKLAFEAP